jgi:hypothetical protein
MNKWLQAQLLKIVALSQCILQYLFINKLQPLWLQGDNVCINIKALR